MGPYKAAPGLSNRHITRYLTALRPWSLTASFSPALLGALLAWLAEPGPEDDHHHQSPSLARRLVLFAATAITALSVHAAGNLVNTYFDFKRGVDHRDKSDDRTLVDRILMPAHVETMAAVCYAIGLCGFIGTLMLAPPGSQLACIVLVFFLGMSGSFLYTGWVALKYVACGEVVIFFTFGPLTVLFAFLAQGGPASYWPMLYALPLSLNTLAILHANNVRDAESDKKSGIVTMAIILGPRASWLLFCCLLLLPYTLLGLAALHTSAWLALPCLTVWTAFDLERLYRGGERDKLPQRLAGLHLITAGLYTSALLLTAYHNIPLPGLK